jgi:hypothetical protein
VGDVRNISRADWFKVLQATAEAEKEWWTLLPRVFTRSADSAGGTAGAALDHTEEVVEHLFARWRGAGVGHPLTLFAVVCTVGGFLFGRSLSRRG